LGLLTPAAIVWAWVRSPNEPTLRVLLATVVIYVLLLTALPLRQSFYLMSVYPLLMLLPAGFVVWSSRQLARYKVWQAGAVAAVVVSIGYSGWITARAYPDFGLVGYERVGTRWLGSESRGYRNLIQVTNDGTEDAIEWCLANVPPGERVASYLWDDHVIDAYLADRNVPFEIVRRLPEASPDVGPSIEDADFVIVAMNNRTTYHDAPPRADLTDRFGPAPVHTVYRGEGDYAMPVVEIYGHMKEKTSLTTGVRHQ